MHDRYAVALRTACEREAEQARKSGGLPSYEQMAGVGETKCIGGILKGNLADLLADVPAATDREARPAVAGAAGASAGLAAAGASTVQTSEPPVLAADRSGECHHLLPCHLLPCHLFSCHSRVPLQFGGRCQWLGR